MQGKAFATIRSYGWAARDLHVRLCGRDLAIPVMWDKAIRYHLHFGIHPHAAKQPFQVSWLARLASGGTEISPLVFAANLGFQFLLRAGEFLDASSTVAHCICWGDAVLVRDSQGLCLQLRVPSSKTDPAASGRVLRRRAVPGDPLCIVAMFQRHCSAHPHALPDSPLMCDAGGSHLRQQDIADVLKYAALLAGADPRRYSCHSLRSGGATALWLACRDHIVVMREGRWSSVATMLRYCRVPPSSASESTALMLNSVIPFGMDTYVAPRAAGARL